MWYTALCKRFIAPFSGRSESIAKQAQMTRKEDFERRLQIAEEDSMHDKSRKAMNFSQFFSNFLNLPSGTGQIRRSFTNLGFLPLGSTLPGITARLRASLTGRVRPSGLLQVDNCWRNPQEHRPRNEPADGRKDSAIGTFAAARTEANQFRSSDSSFPNRNRVVAGELVEGEAGNHFDSVHLHQFNQSGPHVCCWELALLRESRCLHQDSVPPYRSPPCSLS